MKNDLPELRESELTDAVLATLENVPDPRLRTLAQALVQHLHDFVRDTRLTEDEWLAAIRFLTATGRGCNDQRQEFILLSDVLGVSMLVDAVNHRTADGATASTVLGPFYADDAPRLPMSGNLGGEASGEPAYVTGRVLDTEGQPIANAELDIWQTDGEGFYDSQRPGAVHYCRGKLTTGADGRYGFRTVMPVSYPIPTDGPVGALLSKLGRSPYRPAHIHVIATARGYERVATHLFVAGDQYLGSDAVFGVKSSLVVAFEKHSGGETPDGAISAAASYYTAHFDFRLVRASI